MANGILQKDSPAELVTQSKLAATDCTNYERGRKQPKKLVSKQKNCFRNRIFESPSLRFPHQPLVNHHQSSWRRKPLACATSLEWSDQFRKQSAATTAHQSEPEQLASRDQTIRSVSAERSFEQEAADWKLLRV